MTKNWLLEEESGQGLVEYALIMALVAVVVMTALTGLQTAISDRFDAIAQSVKP